MSKIAIKGATTGTGVFTLESPATNTDRTLVLPDEAGTVLTDRVVAVNASAPDDSLVVDASGNVGIGTSSPTLNTNGTVLHINNSTASRAAAIHMTNAESGSNANNGLLVGKWNDGTNYFFEYGSNPIVFGTNSLERLRIDSGGRVTMPYQPFVVLGAPFGARSAGTYKHWGGSGYVFSNVGGHWNSSTQLFTSPIDGKYFVYAQIRMSSESSAAYNYINFINSNTSANGSPLHLWSPANDAGTYRPHSVSWIMHLRAGDTFAPELILNAAATLDGGHAGQTDDGLVIMLIG